MKIYRLTQYLNPEFDIDFHYDVNDYFDEYDRHLNDIITNFKNGQTLTWHPVPLNKLTPVYKHFTSRNYLDHRDIKSLHEVLEQVISNVARLKASTELCEHDVFSVNEMFENAGYHIDEKDEEKFFEHMEFEGHDPISDYGVRNLERIIHEMFDNQPNSPRDLLVILTRLLDVIHQRNDLASWLIQGGSKSLMELSSL